MGKKSLMLKLMVMIIVIIMQNWTLSVNFDKKHNLMVPSTKSFTCLDLNSEKIICELFYIHVEFQDMGILLAEAGRILRKIKGL